MDKNKEGDTGAEKQARYSKEPQETTVIRISKRNYERLRKEAFQKRSTIRQIADDILEHELKEMQ